MITSFTFSSPYWFIGIIPLALLVWRIHRQNSIGFTVPNILLQKYLRPSKLYMASNALIFLIGLMTLGLLAGPKLILETSSQPVPGREIMIVLDISKSMLAEDISPNRIEKAKEILATFIQELESERIGLIVFAGKPFILSPPTTDYDGLRYLLDQIQPDSINQNLPGLSGTAIGDAIVLANTFYTGSASGTGAIIFLTDGKANIGIDPQIALEETRTLPVRLYTVGIGEPAGIFLYTTKSDGQKDYFLDTNGERILVDLDEPLMRSMAEKTGGKYYLARDARDFDEIFRDIGTLTRDTTSPHMIPLEKDASLYVALLLLLLAFVEGYIIRLYRARYNLI